MSDFFRILFFSDSHLGFDYPIKPKIDRRRRGIDFFKNFDYILKYAKEQDINLLLHGGDFFFRSKLPQKIIDISYKKLNEFSQNKIPILIVPGNHERSHLPQYESLDKENIFIFHHPDNYVFSWKDLKLKISGFPYCRTIAYDFRKISQMLNNDNSLYDINIMLMHQAVEGAKVGPQNFTFRSGNETILMRDLPDNYDIFLSGHIHRKQILSKKSYQKIIPIIFSGSIEKTSFAEINEPKGFFEIILQKKANWQIKEYIFHKLYSRPMHILDIPTDIFHKKQLLGFIYNIVTKIAIDSILKINFANIIQAESITMEELRQIVPNTMNIEINASVFRNHHHGENING